MSSLFIGNADVYFICSFIVPKIDLNLEIVKELLKNKTAEAILFREQRNEKLVAHYISAKGSKSVEGYESVLEKDRAKEFEIEDLRNIDILDKFFISENILKRGKWVKIRCKNLYVDCVIRGTKEDKSLSFLKGKYLTPYVFLYTDFNFALILIKIELKNCGVDDLINTSHLFYRENLFLKINNEKKRVKDISYEVIKRVIDEITKLTTERKIARKILQILRGSKFKDIELGDIMLRLIWIRDCKNDCREFTNVEELFNKFTKDLYGLAASDEDWRGIPMRTARDRLKDTTVFERDELMMILHPSGVIHVTLTDKPRKSAKYVINRYSGTIVGELLELPILPNFPLIEATCLSLTILRNIVSKIERIPRFHGLFQLWKFWKIRDVWKTLNNIVNYWSEFLNLLQTYRELLEIPVAKTEYFNKFAKVIGLIDNEELAYSKLERYAHQNYQIITTYLMIALTVILLILTIATVLLKLKYNISFTIVGKIIKIIQRGDRILQSWR